MNMKGLKDLKHPKFLIKKWWFNAIIYEEIAF
jgi:hypothetical protein